MAFEKARNLLERAKVVKRISSADRFDAQLKAASKKKPEVLSRSRALAEPLIESLGALVSRAAREQEDSEAVKTARNEKRALQAGAWVLNISTPIAEGGLDADNAAYRLTDGAKTVEINPRGSTLVTFHGDELGNLGLSDKDIKPEFVASTVDSGEFGLGAATSSRLVSRSRGDIIVGAPLAAHTETAQCIVADFVAAGTEHLAGAPQAAAYAKAEV